MSLVARQKEDNSPDDKNQSTQLPEFLAEEGYEMSTREINENDKKAMEYTLNVLTKLNRAMHDIYVVQKM